MFIAPGTPRSFDVQRSETLAEGKAHCAPSELKTSIWQPELTLHLQSGKQTANHLNLGAAFSF